MGLGEFVLSGNDSYRRISQATLVYSLCDQTRKDFKLLAYLIPILMLWSGLVSQSYAQNYVYRFVTQDNAVHPGHTSDYIYLKSEDAVPEICALMYLWSGQYVYEPYLVPPNDSASCRAGPDEYNSYAIYFLNHVSFDWVYTDQCIAPEEFDPTTGGCTVPQPPDTPVELSGKNFGSCSEGPSPYVSNGSE